MISAPTLALEWINVPDHFDIQPLFIQVFDHTDMASVVEQWAGVEPRLMHIHSKQT